jgi:hypothetical protein
MAGHVFSPMSIRLQSVVDLNELVLSMLDMLRNLFGEVSLDWRLASTS